MSEISILAIDLAKNSFQVCGVRSDGLVVFNRAVSRGRPRHVALGRPRFRNRVFVRYRYSHTRIRLRSCSVSTGLVM